MVSQPRRFAILSIAISMLVIGLECTSAEECDYRTCGALMARDGLVSWAVSGRREYSPDTKRACAELNVRASCGPDVQKLCAGARRESEVLKCLDSQRMELSTTCSLYFQNLGARPSAQKNALNKKPPSPVQTRPIPARENAPSKKPPFPPPSAPVPAPENAPNKEPPSPPPTTPIPD